MFVFVKVGKKDLYQMLMVFVNKLFVMNLNLGLGKTRPVLSDLNVNMTNTSITIGGDSNVLTT